MRLEIRQLYKSFGDHEVLKGVGFAVESGHSLGLLGRNGAGKTTTIRIIMDVFAADSGEVLLDNRPFRQGDVRIGYLPEERGLYPKRLIVDQLVYLANLRGLSLADAKHSVQHWLERMELTEYIGKKVDALSKGNQQKIQLAAAMLNDPQMLILDEPFSGLDPVNAKLLKDIVRESIAAGKIVLFSSHQMSYVEEFCRDIAILNRGEIVLNTDIEAHKRSYDRHHLVLDVPADAQGNAVAYLSGKGLQAEQARGDVHLHVPDGKDTLPILAGLSESGVPVEGYRVFEPSLEDVFVEYTSSTI
ncbi:MAG TPA: ATP-binding cassette domain-containing protein [Candidatus Limiplasma sp.]|mgnify:CR=1 FL=1|nr:ATP-binding cassette domain-containing protein [Candidatus Limiplasma sp.]HRX08832.1 ATP-binding cassette domain-containing protein [Candidatus Limiplasma sp.]